MNHPAVKFAALLLFSISSLTTLSSCGDKDRKFKQAFTKAETTLPNMIADSTFTVVYCWAEWCGPCVSGMKSILPNTKAVTDSLGIPIKYQTILFAPGINDRSKTLMTTAYSHGIEVYHTSSMTPLTQKLAINRLFKPYDGYKAEFMVPRVILFNDKGELLLDRFFLNYNEEQFVKNLKIKFPEYFGG